MPRHLFYFRPGVEARMLARCQFGLTMEEGGGAYFTYPIPGYPWRRNVTRGYGFELDTETRVLLFDEVHRIRRDYPSECLANELLYADQSEKGNSITRDRASHTLCYTVAIYADGATEENYALRETSDALLTAALYRTIAALIAPYERI